MTLGFEVFVHDVIAATVTAPWPRSNVVPSPSVTATLAAGADVYVGSAASNAALEPDSSMRS